MKVNDIDAEPGCFIAGHHGQYALDALTDVAAQFDIELDDDEDPQFWRAAAEAESAEEAAVVSDGPGRIGSHLARPDECMERLVWAADRVEEILNERTTGGYWTWMDGEFFLVQTEVDGWVYVVEEDYESAWRSLVENDGGGAYCESEPALDHADDEGLKVFQFRTTIHYEPED